MPYEMPIITNELLPEQPYTYMYIMIPFYHQQSANGIIMTVIYAIVNHYLHLRTIYVELHLEVHHYYEG